MDREMRAFKGEFARAAGTDGQVAGVEKVSDDLPLCVRDDHAGEIRNNEEARQP
jgi:hypothetical protein